MTGPLWRVLPSRPLRYRAWEDGYVVFNDLSGDTHLLDDSAMQLLLAVADQPGDTACLTGRLRTALGLDEVEAGDIPAMLSDLCALSLIEASPC